MAAAASRRTMSIVDIPEDERPDEEKYQPSKPKTIDEILHTDEEDESLRKYKESLLAKEAIDHLHAPDDPRDCVNISVEFILPDNQAPVTFTETSSDNFIRFKEGIDYQLKLSFNVQRSIVLGLKYVNTVRRLGLPVDKVTSMIGSFAPRVDKYELTLPTDTVPDGMMARGKYKATARFVDDDGNVLSSIDYSFEITKDW